MQHLGRQGYGAIIDHNYALAKTFTDAVKARPFLALASQPQMNLICFRAEPAGMGPHQRDTWNAQLQQWLLTQGNTFLSLPTYRGEKWLKAVLLNPFTTSDHVERLFRHIDQYFAAHQSVASMAKT